MQGKYHLICRVEINIHYNVAMLIMIEIIITVISVLMTVFQVNLG